jgi:lipopolysaccharide/colanic/teichoic acid biosynthesis glycosyltransferase
MRTIKKTSKTTEPTQAQIAKAKNFKKLTHEYDRITKRSKKPLHKDPKLIMLVLLILLVLFMLYLESKEESGENNKQEQKQIEISK